MLNRMLKSISAIFTAQFLNVVGNLLVVPLFLSTWTTGMYGEWMALSALVAYFGITDLGMNAAAGNVLTETYVRGDLGSYKCLQGSAMTFYVAMALGASLFIGIVTVLLPIPSWIGIRQIQPREAVPVICLLAATILFQMPATQLRNIYRTTGDLATTYWFGNLQLMGSLAATVTVLLLHGGVLALAFWGALPTMVVTAIVWLCLRHSHPDLLPKLSEARFEGIRQLLKPSMLFGLIMVSAALTIQGPVLLVSRALGGTAVAMLVTTRTLANILRQAIGVLQAALWPEMTRLGALGNQQTLQLGHRLFSVTVITISAAFAGALWFEGNSVFSVWTQGKLLPDTWLLRCLLLALVLQAPWMASSLFTTATNRHRHLAYSYVISAVLTLVAIGLLLRPCGLLAVPLGGIIGETIASYHFVIKDTCVLLGEDYRHFALRLWSGGAAVSCAAWIAGFLGHSVAVGPAPLRWVEVGTLTSLAAGLAAWRFALRPDDHPLLVQWGNARWTSFTASFVKQTT